MSNKRRFSRFNLKVLLGVTAVLALWLGWVGRNAGNQASAVSDILQAGGKVQYDAPLKGTAKQMAEVVGNDYFQTVVIVRAEGVKFDDSITDSIGMLTGLGSLSLFNAQVTDAGLERLSSCGELKRLNLMHTFVTDDCIPSLLGMENLRFVNLEGTKVTKGGAEELHALKPELEIKHHFFGKN